MPRPKPSQPRVFLAFHAPKSAADYVAAEAVRRQVPKAQVLRDLMRCGVEKYQEEQREQPVRREQQRDPEG